jgi:hypothetical protein
LPLEQQFKVAVSALRSGAGSPAPAFHTGWGWLFVWQPPVLASNTRASSNFCTLSYQGRQDMARGQMISAPAGRLEGGHDGTSAV